MKNISNYTVNFISTSAYVRLIVLENTFHFKVNFISPCASPPPHFPGARGGEGCSFPAVPKFFRRPKPTIPLHSKSINDQLCLRHHIFPTNNSSTISSSILSTARLDVVDCRHVRLVSLYRKIFFFHFRGLFLLPNCASEINQARKYFSF